MSVQMKDGVLIYCISVTVQLDLGSALLSNPTEGFMCLNSTLLSCRQLVLSHPGELIWTLSRGNWTSFLLGSSSV